MNVIFHEINYKEENVLKRVNEITNNKGVPVVYDGVGKSTLEGSLKCMLVAVDLEAGLPYTMGLISQDLSLPDSYKIVSTSVDMDFGAILYCAS